MFVLRYLTSSNAGREIELRPGSYVIGRSPSCEIPLQDRGISKQHMRLQVTEDKVIVTDLESTNGTFVNGLKVQFHRLQPGDKLMVHTFIFELAIRPEFGPTIGPVRLQQTLDAHAAGAHLGEQAPAWADGNLAFDSAAQAIANPEHSPSTVAKINVQSLADLGEFLRTYMNTVALPGVYRLAEWVEYKFVIAGFLGAFILLVTVLSSIPMIHITRQSVQNESQRRAMTLARYLAERNHDAIVQHNDTALDVNLPHEEGIKESLIVAISDGHIMAPASRAGTYDSMNFVQEARSKAADYSEVIDSSTVGAAVPITYYDPNKGEQVTTAMAIVIYDLGSVAVTDGRIASLFMEVFTIALALGLILFYFLIKFVEWPVVELNSKLDGALKDSVDSIDTTLIYPPLKHLYSNINSALSRVGQSSEMNPASTPQILSSNMQDILQLMDSASLILHGSDGQIVDSNSRFQEITGLTAESLKNQPLSSITDYALKLNLEDLLARAREIINQPQTGEIEFSGRRFKITCVPLALGSSVAYYIFNLKPEEEAA